MRKTGKRRLAQATLSHPCREQEGCRQNHSPIRDFLGILHTMECAGGTLAVGGHMFAKINHVAIVSDDYAQLAKFYEAVFGMHTSAKSRPSRAVTVGDGYVGLNINPRRAGRSAG